MKRKRTYFKGETKANEKPLSPARIKYLKNQKNVKTAIFLSRWLILIAFSSPTRILNTLKNLSASGDLAKHIFTTLFETVAGFAAATAIGTVTAMLLWWFQPLKKNARTIYNRA